MKILVSKFELKFGLLQTFGCIYDTNQEIKRPIQNPPGFCNIE